MKVVSLSGGRSSAMMLKIMQDNNQLDDAIICFANTGRESEATLKFIDDIAQYWSLDIVWLEYRKALPKFEIVNFDTASRKDSPRPFDELLEGKYLPNPVKRICTAELKIKTIRRYIRSLGIRGKFDTYLGLRYDEPNRVAKKKAQNAAGKEAEVCFMPLYDLRVTKSDRDKFWREQPFSLDISSHHDNCDLCFMKGFYNLIWSIRASPNSVDWWIEKELSSRKTAKRKRNGQFRKEYSYSDLKAFALRQTHIPLPDDTLNHLPCECSD